MYFIIKMDKKEIARDVLALGSWVFYLIVIARALIKPYRPFADQIIIAAIVLILIGLVYKNWDGYVARALVLVVFTTIFYQSMIYGIFVSLVGMVLIYSSWYVGNTSKKIFYGLVVGVISIVVGYYGAGLY